MNIGTQTKSTAKENSHAISTAAGVLLSALVTNCGGADLHLLVIDKATALAPGDVPVQPFFVAAGGTLGVDIPIRCSNGILVALSTTPHQYTSPGAAVGWFTTRHQPS